MKGLRYLYRRVPATVPEDAIAFFHRCGQEAMVLQCINEPWKDIYEVREGDELMGACMSADYFQGVAECLGMAG